MTAQKLGHIEKKNLAVIVTLLTIYWEVVFSMIDVVLITPWELLKMLYTGMAVTEFSDIFFEASGKTFEFVQADFKEMIFLADENSTIHT